MLWLPPIITLYVHVLTLKSLASTESHMAREKNMQTETPFKISIKTGSSDLKTFVLIIKRLLCGKVHEGSYIVTTDVLKSNVLHGGDCNVFLGVTAALTFITVTS